MNLTDAAARYPQAAKELDEIRAALTAMNIERMHYLTVLAKIEQAHEASADDLRHMARLVLLPF